MTRAILFIRLYASHDLDLHRHKQHTISARLSCINLTSKLIQVNTFVASIPESDNDKSHDDHKGHLSAFRSGYDPRGATTARLQHASSREMARRDEQH